jgi:hypothetical protein
MALCLLLLACPSLTVGIPPRRMPSGLGMNLWNIGWGSTWTDYFKPSLDWKSVADPWNPVFLEDLARFKGPIRFMDWDNANDSPIMHWADRTPKTGDHYAGRTIPIDPSIQKYYPDNADGRYGYVSVAYEWMIDLCNRTGRDMWICVPTFADDDYCGRLASLIKSSLDPSLKVYLEYSNETWNTSFKSYQYTVDRAVALGLPGANDGYWGGAYSVLRSLQVFKLFEDVFGAENTGIDRRLVRCLCAGGNEDISSVAIRDIVYDGTVSSDYSGVPYNATYNPYGQNADVYALAPYVGSGLDGADPDIVAKFRTALSEKVTQVKVFKSSVINKYHYPLISYEGGQHLLNNADAFSRNPAIYGEYLNYLDTWKEEGFLMFVHYTLYGSWNSGGAWGAKESAASDTERSYKFRALVDWQATNP